MWINAIGGYPELELPPAKQTWHENAMQYQSARAAFAALLQNMPEVRRVWMPVYICDSMLSPLKFAGKECAFYNIDEQFNIAASIQLKEDDLLLYVNYFGVCEPGVHRVLERFNPQQVIIDCSQAFFTSPYECLATIYSPRKFFGVPDGGLMFANREIVPPHEQDNDSILRMEHLITRLAVSAEAGYASYQRAEASLENCSPKAMSELTRKLLGVIDYLAVQRKRLENFSALHEALGEENQLNIDSATVTPLCYPFFPAKKIDIKRLAEKRVFIPTYWSDAASRDAISEFESDLINGLISIPCNQKLNLKPEIDFLVGNIRGGLL